MVRSVANGVPIARDFPLMPEALAASLTATTILGARATDASIRVDDLVTEAFRPWLDASAKACTTDPITLPLPAVNQYLKLGTAYDRLETFLSQQDPTTQTMRVPVWIAQAGADQFTPTPQTTAQMVNTLCARGGAISLTPYPGQDHSQVVTASLLDALAFADATVAGSPLSYNACDTHKP